MLWPPDVKNWLIGKWPWYWERLKAGGEGHHRGWMVGWHHWLDGHEFGQAPEVGDDQGTLVCCSPWGLEWGTTERLNNIGKDIKTENKVLWDHTSGPLCLQSFPASGSFAMSQFFASGGQSIGISASASVLPMNVQDWFSLGLTDLVSLQSKGLSRVFCNTTVQKHQFFSAQPSLSPNSHPYMTTGKTIALTVWIFVGKLMPLLFNVLSRLITVFLPRSKCLLLSCSHYLPWFWSPRLLALFPHLFAPLYLRWWNQMPWKTNRVYLNIFF